MQWKLNRSLKFIAIPAPLLLKLKPTGISHNAPFSSFRFLGNNTEKGGGVSFKNPVGKLG